MKKKYSCDRSTTATRLEDLLQDAVVSDDCLHYIPTSCILPDVWHSEENVQGKRRSIYQDCATSFVLIYFVFVINRRRKNS